MGTVFNEWLCLSGFGLDTPLTSALRQALDDTAASAEAVFDERFIVALSSRLSATGCKLLGRLCWDSFLVILGQDSQWFSRLKIYDHNEKQIH